MKRMLIALVLTAVLLMSTVALAASPEPSATQTPRTIGLTLYLTDASGQPLANTVVLVQKSLDAEDAFEGKTDGRGAVAIPKFPLTSFLLATRNDDNTVTGMVNVSLYPGDSTEIMNKPEVRDSVTKAALENTAFARNIGGSRAVETEVESLPLNHYEVEVRDGSAGLACLFELTRDHSLLLRGVGEGEAGEIAPEPTLPPGDEDRPDSPTVSPSATASATPSATRTSTPSPTESADSSEESSASPSPSPSEEPTPSSTPEPITEPMTPSPTAAPTEAPTTAPPATEPPATESPATQTPAPSAAVPEPTAAPTTLEDYINMKLFLKDQNGNALSYYVAVLNSVAQATCNEDGEAYFTNVPTTDTNQLVVRNTLGDQVGSCSLRFVEGSETTLASVNTGGMYTINYARGSQDVYVEIVVDVQEGQPTQVVIEEVSSTPLDPGTVATAEPTPTPSTDAAAAPSGGADEVIGAPSGGSTGGPSVSGYFSNEAGIAIQGATIRLVNEDTRNLSSSITNSDGAFGMGQLPPANYSLNAIDPQGRNLGTIQFTVARGKRTQVKEASDGKTYLTEGPDDSTVYMDLRELSNGSLDLMYASKSPLAAPAVLGSFSPLPSSSLRPEASASEDANLAIDQEVVDVTEIERPGQEQEADAGTVVFVVVLCAMGVAVAAILLVRHARIR